MDLSSEPVFGMRGGIPGDRMKQIHSELPYSLLVRELAPILVDPLSALKLFGINKVEGIVRLSEGWHLLNESRSALVEADACKIFYQEVQPNPTEAIYRSRFFLDDATLRLHPSCLYAIDFVRIYWSVPKNKKEKQKKNGGRCRLNTSGYLLGPTNPRPRQFGS
ncbi:MAG: hypothetical protein ACR2IV_20260 [Bryobacteraceae bacterium]